MKDLAVGDRPREKLVRAGAEALGDNELLALVLGAGTRQRDALTVARDLLSAVGGAEGLAGASVDELLGVAGIGRCNAARIVAAVELGRRVIVRPVGERPRFASSGDMARYLLSLYGGFRVERFGVMLLDTRYRLIRTAIVSMGELDRADAAPRQIFREAIVASAHAVVMFHNHPSGDPAPSGPDVVVTRQLEMAGDQLGIRVADHIILGRDRYFSFREANRLL